MHGRQCRIGVEHVVEHVVAEVERDELSTRLEQVDLQSAQIVRGQTQRGHVAEELEPLGAKLLEAVAHELERAQLGRVSAQLGEQRIDVLAAEVELPDAELAQLVAERRERVRLDALEAALDDAQQVERADAAKRGCAQLGQLVLADDEVADGQASERVCRYRRELVLLDEHRVYVGRGDGRRFGCHRWFISWREYRVGIDRIVVGGEETSGKESRIDVHCLLVVDAVDVNAARTARIALAVLEDARRWRFGQRQSWPREQHK